IKSRSPSRAPRAIDHPASAFNFTRSSSHPSVGLTTLEQCLAEKILDKSVAPALDVSNAKERASAIGYKSRLISHKFRSKEKIQREPKMIIEIDLNQVIDKSIPVVIVLSCFFVGMRVLYGYWPWQAGPKQRRMRPVKPEPDTPATLKRA